MWLIYLSFACGMHLSPREFTQVFVSRTCDNYGNALVRNGVIAMHAEEADAIAMHWRAKSYFTRREINSIIGLAVLHIGQTNVQTLWCNNLVARVARLILKFAGGECSGTRKLSDLIDTLVRRVKCPFRRYIVLPNQKKREPPPPPLLAALAKSVRPSQTPDHWQKCVNKNTR
jgi:hypothetical protein